VPKKKKMKKMEMKKKKHGNASLDFDDKTAPQA